VIVIVTWLARRNLERWNTPQRRRDDSAIIANVIQSSW